MAFAGAEADVVAIAMDDDGLRVDALAERLAAGVRPKFLYMIPEYQNPTGRTLPLERRRALVELCRRHGVLIFEDVAYRELPFDGTSLPSLWSLGARRRAAGRARSPRASSPACGSAGRAGPAEVIAELSAAKQNTDQCAGGLGQRMLEEYGRAGGFERHLPAARALYASHWAALSAALTHHMPDGGRLDRADRRLPHLAHAARGARHARAAPGRPRRRRRLRPRPAVPRRRRRRQHAAAVVQPPDRDRARDRRRAPRRRGPRGARAGRSRLAREAGLRALAQHDGDVRREGTRARGRDDDPQADVEAVAAVQRASRRRVQRHRERRLAGTRRAFALRSDAHPPDMLGAALGEGAVGDQRRDDDPRPARRGRDRAAQDRAALTASDADAGCEP